MTHLDVVHVVKLANGENKGKKMIVTEQMDLNGQAEINLY